VRVVRYEVRKAHEGGASCRKGAILLAYVVTENVERKVIEICRCLAK